jgi:hypothetical protein
VEVGSLPAITSTKPGFSTCTDGTRRPTRDTQPARRPL